MKIKSYYIIILFGYILLFTQIIWAAEYIKVGTFNIANFGDRDEYKRSLISLVNIINEMDADVIAIQEVEPNELGSEQVSRLTTLLNKAAKFYDKNHYDFAIADDYTGDETVAFLWREPVTLESEISLLEHDEDPDGNGKRTFQRVPSVALFNAGDYDFYIVNCHLYTKLSGSESEGRAAEYDALVTWLEELAEEVEKDAIVLGDFNRFLKNKKSWKHLMIDGHDEFFRFPLLEGIKSEVSAFDPKKSHAPEDKYSTTTSSKSPMIYDQILISEGSYNEFTQSLQFGVDVGIIVFDNDKQYEWFIDNWHNAIALLTDHRPVWIRMQIDKGDDD